MFDRTVRVKRIILCGSVNYSRLHGMKATFRFGAKRTAIDIRTSSFMSRLFILELISLFDTIYGFLPIHPRRVVIYFINLSINFF